jgi:selenocysteine lyase/cysteine desulfurase
MLICAHASNICSSVQPIAQIGALCHRHGILFVVDAAQSAGHIPIDVGLMQIDALCVPGHKGLLGPQGSGALLLDPSLFADTLVEGGSGYNSLEWEMPQDPPERFEAGTLATPAIAGLCEGIRTVKRIGVERVGGRIREWNRALRDRLASIPEVTVYTPHHTGSILLFNLNGIPADRVGRALDRRGICVRTGYHCSALGHATLQTPHGGAVRVSPGYQSTQAEISALVRAIEEILAESR